jgi:Kef-type K+ transport system membrane component KefB
MDVIRLAALAGICALSYVAGEGFARLHIPRLPVYLAAGALSGVLIKSAVETANVAFPAVSAVALGVIGFVAGSHLVWGSVKPRIKTIALQVVGMTVAVPIVVGVTVFALIPGIPVEGRLAAAIMAGTVMIALSPPEAIAVISESRAVGPFTKLVLGATVVMDVVVVSLFSMSLMVSKALVGEGGSASEVVVSVVAGLVLAIVAGLLVGLLLRAVVRRVASAVAVGTLVIAISALAAWLAEYAMHVAQVSLGVEVEIEALLVCMIAGIFVANMSHKPEQFAAILEKLAPWVYVVFFTLTGLGLHLEALIAAAVPAAALWALRVAGLWGGSSAAMAVAKEPPVVRRVAWRAFVPQAGIALALASTIAVEFPKAGPVFSTLIIATVVLNEATGPFFLRSALRAAGETEPDHEILS